MYYSCRTISARLTSVMNRCQLHLLRRLARKKSVNNYHSVVGKELLGT